MDPPVKAPVHAANDKKKKTYKSIVIIGLPDNLLNDTVLREHFSELGSMCKLKIDAKNKNAIVTFDTTEDAQFAKENGSTVRGYSVKILYTDKGQKRDEKDPKATSSKTLTPRSLIRKPSLGKGLPAKSALQAKTSAKKIMAAPKTFNPAPALHLTQPTTAAPLMSPIEAPIESKASPAKQSKPAFISSFAPIPSFTPIPSSHGTTAEQQSLFSFHPDTAEAKQLFETPAFTAEERYKLLESRDKLIRSKNPKVKVTVEHAVKLAGTCKDMCPEKERYMREVQRQLYSYEMIPGRDYEVDHKSAVKAYSRSSADQEEPLPHELRPIETLEMSLLYLLHNLIPIVETKQEADLATWYNYLWDRMRSIRKDITQQQLHDFRAVALMEKCARFHIFCSSRLCELDSNAFDAKLNDENLMKCLQSLEHMYTDLNLRGKRCPNEPEFRAYQVLMNLNEGDVLLEAQQKPEWVQKSPELQFAIKLHMTVFQKNYARFFKMVRQAPYLTSCILHRYFYQVRATAMQTIIRAYCKSLSMESHAAASDIQRVLGFGENFEAFSVFCESHGVQFSSLKDHIILNRRSFYEPDSPVISREFHLIESKLDNPVNVVINGGPLNTNPVATHVPHTSFDARGCLIPGDLTGVPQNKANHITATIPAVRAVKSDHQLRPLSGLASLNQPTRQPSPTIFGSWKESTNIKPSITGFLPVADSLHKTTTFLKPSGSLSNSPSVFKPSDTGPRHSMFEPFSQFGKVGSPPRASTSASGLFNSSAFSGRPASSSLLAAFSPAKPAQSLYQDLPPTAEELAAAARVAKISIQTDQAFDALVSGVLKDLVTKHRMEHILREKLIRREKERTAEIAKYYHKMESKVIADGIQRIWNCIQENRRKLHLDSVRLMLNLTDRIILSRVTEISKAVLAEQKEEYKRKLNRFKFLVNRARQREWIKVWRAAVTKRKEKRAKEAEARLLEMENFPAYQNTVLSSPREILENWTGYPVYSPSYKLRLANAAVDHIRTNEKSLLQPSNQPSSPLTETEVKTIVELYNFPSHSNTSCHSPSDILASWCGLSPSIEEPCSDFTPKRRKYDQFAFSPQP